MKNSSRRWAADPSGQQLSATDTNKYPPTYPPGFVGPRQKIDGFEWTDYGITSVRQITERVFGGHAKTLGGNAEAIGLTIDFETLSADHPLRIEGNHDIRSFKLFGCNCAKVYSAKPLRLPVLSIVRKSPKATITATGYQAIYEHELRRVLVYRKAFTAYATPWRREGREALKCGIVCRKAPGEARRVLAKYLDANQRIAKRQFNDTDANGNDSWVVGQQYEITKEHGYISYDSRRWITGISKVHNVGDPPAIRWKPCPSPN